MKSMLYWEEENTQFVEGNKLTKLFGKKMPKKKIHGIWFLF